MKKQELDINNREYSLIAIMTAFMVFTLFNINFNEKFITVVSLLIINIIVIIFVFEFVSKPFYRFLVRNKIIE